VACERLANLHDAEAIMQATELTDDWFARRILALGLGTPEGREAVLAVIADAEQPMDKRVLHAMLLPMTGVIYHVAYSDITSDSWKPQGAPRDGNARYITRIAQLAADNAGEEALCLALIDAVRSGCVRCASNSEPDLLDDGTRALAILKDLYDATDSEEIKFAVEMASRTYSRQAYERLGSACGPVISILRAEDPTKHAPTDEPTLIVRYQANVWPGDEATYEMTSVLEHVSSGRQFVSPWPGKAPIDAGGRGGSLGIPVPKEAPRGAYRVYLQFRRDGKVVSTGHSLTADL
jgi:hypothetical protein